MNFLIYPLAVLAAFIVPFQVHGLSPSGDPWLLTPGPITTSLTVKQAMLHDYGSRDTLFIGINREVCNQILAIANGTKTHVTVPLQGSGTFTVEAMIQTMLSEQDCLLIASNGAYGRRMATICKSIPKQYHIIEFPEDQPINIDTLRAYLSEHPEITHVAAVYCETTTGMLNPIQEIAAMVAEEKRALLIDAISAFGALPFDCQKTDCDAIAISSNKCLQGLPGCGFCIVKKSSLEKAQGNSKSLSLDLYDQWTTMEKTGQWRFTPPIQTICALHKALQEFEHEGGLVARQKRYRQNLDLLVQEMALLGFTPYLSKEHQAPIIVTFLTPSHPKFDFTKFYLHLKEKGFVIYPGKLTQVDSFRIGCIGDIQQEQINNALHAIKQVLVELNITL